MNYYYFLIRSNYANIGTTTTVGTYCCKANDLFEAHNKVCDYVQANCPESYSILHCIEKFDGTIIPIA